MTLLAAARWSQTSSGDKKLIHWAKTPCKLMMTYFEFVTFTYGFKWPMD